MKNLWSRKGNITGCFRYRENITRRKGRQDENTDTFFKTGVADFTGICAPADFRWISHLRPAAFECGYAEISHRRADGKPPTRNSAASGPCGGAGKCGNCLFESYREMCNEREAVFCGAFHE